MVSLKPSLTLSQRAARAWGHWRAQWNGDIQKIGLAPKRTRAAALKRGHGVAHPGATQPLHPMAASAMHKAPFGMAVLGHDGALQWANPAALRHFGLKPQYLGLNITHILPQSGFAQQYFSQARGREFYIRLANERVLALTLVSLRARASVLLYSREVEDKAEFSDPQQTSASAVLLTQTPHLTPAPWQAPMRVLRGYARTLQKWQHGDKRQEAYWQHLQQETDYAQNLWDSAQILQQLQHKPQSSDPLQWLGLDQLFGYVHSRANTGELPLLAPAQAVHVATLGEHMQLHGDLHELQQALWQMAVWVAETMSDVADLALRGLPGTPPPCRIMLQFKSISDDHGALRVAPLWDSSIVPQVAQALSVLAQPSRVQSPPTVRTMTRERALNIAALIAARHGGRLGQSSPAQTQLKPLAQPVGALDLVLPAQRLRQC